MRLLALLFPYLLAAQLTVPKYELNHRIDLTINRLTDMDARPAYTENFLLADVDLQPEDPRRFYNFSGDLSGRYIEVMSLVDPAQRGTVDLDELVRRVIDQQRADGRFGDPDLTYTADEIGGEHMALLWGNGRLLVGLMTYYEQTSNPEALAAARRLGDFFIGTAEQSRQPAIAERLKGFGAKGIICFTQYIEGLVQLARATGESRFIQAAVDAYTVLPERGEVHTHGYLTTLRGVMLLHELVGTQRLLDYAKTTFDDLLASKDYTRHGAVMEYFGGHGERDEGCSSADFVRLAFQLYAATGEARYREVAERGLHNALFYNQYASGDFGHHYFTPGGMSASNPRRSWWCCTMHGLRALLEVRDRYMLTKRDDTTELQLLVTQDYRDEYRAFTLQHTGQTAGTQTYELRIEQWEGSALRLPLPLHTEYVPEGTSRTVRPSAGDRFTLTYRHELILHDASDHAVLPLPDRPQSAYLTYGPYLIGINQDDFVAEPDWGNQVSLTDLQAGNLPLSLQATYRHGGYPGQQSVRIQPVGYQTYADHPYLRVATAYGSRIVPAAAD